MQEDEIYEKNKALLKAKIGRFLKKKRLLSKKSLTLFCYENAVPIPR
jgi:hypothetical protein